MACCECLYYGAKHGKSMAVICNQVLWYTVSIAELNWQLESAKELTSILKAVHLKGSPLE
jgi:hypothetical protein